jgi:hypothetical protein
MWGETRERLVLDKTLSDRGNSNVLAARCHSLTWWLCEHFVFCLVHMQLGYGLYGKIDWSFAATA